MGFAIRNDFAFLRKTWASMCAEFSSRSAIFKWELRLDLAGAEAEAVTHTAGTLTGSAPSRRGTQDRESEYRRKDLRESRFEQTQE